MRGGCRLATALAGVAVVAVVAAGCGANDNGGVITPPKGATASTAVPGTPPSTPSSSTPSPSSGPGY